MEGSPAGTLDFPKDARGGTRWKLRVRVTFCGTQTFFQTRPIAQLLRHTLALVLKHCIQLGKIGLRRDGRQVRVRKARTALCARRI